MFKKRGAFVAGIAAAILVLTGCSGGAAPSGSDSGEAEPVKTEKVRIAIPAQAAQFWDIFVAETEGFFADNHIEAEVTLTPGPAATLAALSGGAADVGTPFAEQGLAAMEKGAPISIFVGESNEMLVAVVGKKGVSTADDLRGQKVASSNVDDVATLMMERWLKTKGVNEGDFDKIIVGSSSARFQALQSGGAAAATLIAPTSFQAIREGYPLIKRIAEPGVLTAHFGTNKFLEGKPDVAARYAKSMQDAVAWLLDPANEKAAVDALVQKTKVSESDAQSTYDLYIGDGDTFIKGSPIKKKLLATSLSFLSDTGRVSGNPNPDDYINPEPLKAAAKLK